MLPDECRAALLASCSREQIKKVSVNLTIPQLLLKYLYMNINERPRAPVLCRKSLHVRRYRFVSRQLVKLTA
jgi:hypothetical protein